MKKLSLYLDVIELEGWVLKKVELGAMGARDQWLGATAPIAPPLDPPLMFYMAVGSPVKEI